MKMNAVLWSQFLMIDIKAHVPHLFVGIESQFVHVFTLYFQIYKSGYVKVNM